MIEPIAGPEAAAVLQQYWYENAITRPYFNVSKEPANDAFLDEVSTHPVFRLSEADGIAAPPLQ